MQSPSKLLKTGTMPDTNTILALVLINVMAGLMVSFVTNRWFVKPGGTVVQVLPEHVVSINEEVIS